MRESASILTALTRSNLGISDTLRTAAMTSHPWLAYLDANSRPMLKEWGFVQRTRSQTRGVHMATKRDSPSIGSCDQYGRHDLKMYTHSTDRTHRHLSHCIERRTWPKREMSGQVQWERVGVALGHRSTSSPRAPLIQGQRLVPFQQWKEGEKSVGKQVLFT